MVPGERMETADRKLIEQYLSDGLEVQGIFAREGVVGLDVLSENGEN